MKTFVSASLLLLSLLVGFSTTASAAATGEGSRYYMETASAFWRSAFGARHVFENGFTADLSDLQLRIAHVAGLAPVSVTTLNILADEIIPIPTPQTTPSQRVSWGVRSMLDDPARTTTEGGAGVSIALIDTGIDATHPDLKARISGCFDTTGYSEEITDGSCEDLNGHGTHMAGILVADGGPEGLGSFGFAPQASLSAYRVCSPSGFCFSDDIAVAIYRATDAGANIIVLGMGGESQNALVRDAVSYAASHGVLVVAGAGNDGPYDDSTDWPARDPKVVSVAAIDNSLELADFSSHGIVEFAAPGVNIESTFPGGGYAILSGTSMAAPHIAGIAAIMWQFSADDPATATRFKLKDIARDIGDSGHDSSTGWGVPQIPDSSVR